VFPRAFSFTDVVVVLRTVPAARSLLLGAVGTPTRLVTSAILLSFMTAADVCSVIATSVVSVSSVVILLDVICVSGDTNCTVSTRIVELLTPVTTRFAVSNAVVSVLTVSVGSVCVLAPLAVEAVVSVAAAKLELVCVVITPPRA